MKTRSLKPESITNIFRRANGNVSIQIEDEAWVVLSPQNDEEDVQRFINARNLGTLTYVTFDEDLLIVGMEIDS